MRIQVQVVHDCRAPGATGSEMGQQDRNGEEGEQGESLRRVLGSLPLSPDLLTVPLASQVRKLGSREEN